MKNFAVKHPVIFSILLFFAGLVLALVCSLPCAVIGLENGTDIGRILASVILLLVFRYALPKNSFFKGLGLIIPGLLFVAWNIAYNLLSGASVTTPGLADVIACIAPALFEETIFRVISIYFLKENGRSDLEALILSAVIFGAVHLTNIAGMTPVNAAVQAGYAAVIGLVFGAVYLRSHDMVSVILLHFLIDFSNRFFTGSTVTTPVMIIAFVIVLVIEAVYAVTLVKGRTKN
jgi:membrane protease YdiL (CAAX protease family)